MTAESNGVRPPMDADSVCEGVFIEVLWDVVTSVASGRRKGEEAESSVWWRAEVTKVDTCGDGRKITLRYVAANGFDEQCNTVWLFPRHVRLVDDNTTQLRWRFFECSGNVDYDDGARETIREADVEDDLGDTATNARVSVIEDKVAQLFANFGSLQQLVVAQNDMFARAVRGGPQVNDRFKDMFGALRQKVALMLQRPLPAHRQKGENEEDHFDRGYSGCLRTEVDCTHDQFRSLCQEVRSKLHAAHFHPPYSKLQSDEAALEGAEIQFRSLADLGALIGITRTKDLLTMLRRVRGSVGEKSSDAAVRILGTCFIDEEDEKSPAAILVGHTLHVGCLQDKVSTLYRENRQFDMRLMCYCHPPNCQRDTVEGIIKRVYHSRISRFSNEIQKRAVRGIVKETRKFSLRWRKLPHPSGKFWSRSVVSGSKNVGELEIELPYVVIRGSETIREMNKLMSYDFMVAQLGIVEEPSCEMTSSAVQQDTSMKHH